MTGEALGGVMCMVRVRVERGGEKTEAICGGQTTRVSAVVEVEVGTCTVEGGKGEAQGVFISVFG